MRSRFSNQTEFEACLEQALLDRSQNVLAPRRLFDGIENRLGDQRGRSFTEFVTGFLPSTRSRFRRVVSALAPLAALIVIAVLAVSSRLLFGGEPGVADMPPTLDLSLGPPELTIDGPEDSVAASSPRDSQGSLFVTGTPWTVAAGMNQPRENHGSAALRDGRVLVFGGFDAGGPVTSTEIYDSELDTWTTVGEFPYELPNYKPPVVLNDGRVLVVGGSSVREHKKMSTWYRRDSVLFDPASGEWELVEGLLKFDRVNAESVLLPDGRVLTYGGTLMAPTLNSLNEVFDPRTGQWTRQTDLTETDLPGEHRAWGQFGAPIIVDVDDSVDWGIYSLLPTDRVIFLDAKGQWASIDTSKVNFGSLFAGVLSVGRVVIGTGTREFGESGRAYFYDPTSNNPGWVGSSGLDASDRELRALATVDGYVFVVVEVLQDAFTEPELAMRVIANDQSVWKLIGDFPAPTLVNFGVTQISSDKILISGGQLGSGQSGSYSDASYVLQLPPD